MRAGQRSATPQSPGQAPERAQSTTWEIPAPTYRISECHEHTDVSSSQGPLYRAPMTDAAGAEAAPGAEEVTIVLAAVDTSTLASRVIDLAARIARRTWDQAQLHLVHVFRTGPFNRPSTVGLRSEDLVAEARSYLEFHLRMARRQCPSPVTGHFAE